MKKLPLTSPTFQALLKSYTNWLEVLGYAPTTVYNLPNCLKEFFHYLEQQGLQDITLVTTTIVSEYYDYLSLRDKITNGKAEA